jgi:hypothetical protein
MINGLRVQQSVHVKSMVDARPLCPSAVYLQLCPITSGYGLIAECQRGRDDTKFSFALDVLLVHSWRFIIQGQQPQVKSAESRFVGSDFDIGSHASSPVLGLWKWSFVIDTRQRTHGSSPNAKSPKKGFGPNRPDWDSGENEHTNSRDSSASVARHGAPSPRMANWRARLPLLG